MPPPPVRPSVHLLCPPVRLCVMANYYTPGGYGFVSCSDTPTPKQVVDGDVTAFSGGGGGGGSSRPSSSSSSSKKGRRARGGGGELFEAGQMGMGISASDIYGLEHLVRMLAALPSMMGPVSAALRVSEHHFLLSILLAVVDDLVF